MRTELEQRTTLVAALANREYSYSEIASLVGTVNKILDDAVDYVNNLESTYPELFANLDEGTRNGIQNLTGQITAKVAEVRGKLNLDLRLEQLSSIFKLYQVQTSTAPATASPRELVNFLLAHQNDEKLSGAMTKDSVSRLELVQYIMNHQTTGYTFYDLATAFRLDGGKLKLVYALYEYRHVNPEPNLSLKALINFIDYKILPNPEYANRLGEDERSKLGTIAILMRAAEAGVQYNYDSLYRAILPLANDLEKNKLFLVYLYYGSFYDYDENWTLTLEQFIDFVNDKMLPDSRFASRIDDEMREKVVDGYKTIHDAKDLLVGPVHNRALFETSLPAEGEETFTFIRELKEKLGPKNNVDYFFAGESAMAYEMSQTFSGEMDFITIITMLAIFAVVVCTFKSIFVSLLLVLVIQCAVYIVMAYLSITGASIYFIALIIVQAILMGATIDYAILFTSYYAENRKFFQLSRKDALIQTYNKSIHAILTSALILIIVTAVLGNFTTAIAGKICSSISLGTICATIIILVLLPALLVTLDRFIIKKKESKHLLFKIF